MAAVAAVAAPASREPPQPATQDPLSGALRGTLTPENVHVLLVDDERLSRVVVGNLLRKCHYRVSLAESGTEALSLLRANPPGTFQLVLTDVMMPDVDGIELLRFLRGNDSYAAVPVVMMSANEHNDTVFECIRGGAEDYLLKPVTRKEVQHIWQHVWRRQQQLLVPSIIEETDEMRAASGQASVPTAVVDATSPTAAAAAAAQAAPTSEALPRLPSTGSGDRKQHGTAEPAAAAAGVSSAPPLLLDGMRPLGLRAADLQRLHPRFAEAMQQARQAPTAAAAAPQPRPPVVQQQLQPPQLPPSRPLAELLAPGACSGEDAFRVLCQVMGLARAAHGKGMACGRLRPSALRVTASHVVFVDPAASVLAEEEAQYAAPEQLPRPAASPAASIDSTGHSGPAAGTSTAARRHGANQSGSTDQHTANQSISRPSGSPTPRSDMYSLGLLLLQLLHPAADSTVSAAVLRDARHGILPNSLLQRRPAEAALLTALLHLDPHRRPAIDDVLRSGMLKQLHASLTAPQPGSSISAAAHPPAPPASAPSATPFANAAATTAAPAGKPAAADEQRIPAVASPAAPARILEQAPSAALADGDALAEFLGLARDSIAAEAATLLGQLAALDEDHGAVAACLAAVQEKQRQSTVAAQQAAPVVAASSDGRGQTVEPTGQSAPAPAPQQGASSRKRSREHTDVAADTADNLMPAMQLPAIKTGREQQAGGSSAARPPPAGLPTKAARVSAVLPAVDTAFFRRRNAASAHSDAAGVEATQLTGDALQQTLSLGGAAVPWEAGSIAADDEAASLPPHLQAFGRDLDRFSRYGGFRVASNLKYGDGMTAPDMVCSVAFDRDDEFFATAGVSRRVKVYEYSTLLDGSKPRGAAHYPVLDLPFRAKLSCVAWNFYLKSHLLAADYDGITTLVDTAAGTEVANFAEHAKRVWSVDFSTLDPQRFLSGSDDGTVRLWSIHDEGAMAAIDAKANVCSVQFSPTNANLMAFGAANYRTYIYDLRHIQNPLAVISGHSRAISYVRFMGGSKLLTASTDNALKLWDIASEVSRPSGQPAIADVTYRGHVNEKNFVGLSVTPDGYIATGSEDNCVVAYHASMPTPIARHCFSGGPNHAANQTSHSAVSTYGGATAAAFAASGRRGGGNNPQVGPGPPERPHAPEPQQFVSSVAWTRSGRAAVASNSQGHLRILELV